MKRKLAALFCGCFLFAFVAYADAWDKKTTIKISEPLIVAGVPVVTLEPGTYVIKLLNSNSNRNIVQIFNEREDHVFTTVLAIPNYRLTPTDKTHLGYWETPRGNPPALRAWFYPADSFGQEFVYPKGLAAKIARETGHTVLTTQAQTVEEFAVAPVTETTKEGIEEPLEIAALAEPAPLEAAATPAPAPPEPPPAASLPATGSPYFAGALVALTLFGLGIPLWIHAGNKS